jgi:hypothetical protein
VDGFQCTLTHWGLLITNDWTLTVCHTVFYMICSRILFMRQLFLPMLYRWQKQDPEKKLKSWTFVNCKHSTTWAMPLSLSVLGYFSDEVLIFARGQPWTMIFRTMPPM